MNEVQLLSCSDYDKYYNQILNIANEYNIELYDFNLCKEGFLDITKDELMSDAGHLNAHGSQIFTPILWNVLENNKSSNEDLFYSSFEEKMSNTDSSTVYGIYYEKNETNRDCYIATNKTGKIEFKISKKLSDNQIISIQDYSLNNHFYLPNDESGTIIIEYTDEIGENHTIEISF